MMRPATFALALLTACLLPACGQKEEETAPPPPPPTSGKPPPEIIQALFEAEGKENFETALAAARKARLAEQAILEARFLFLFEHDDRPAIAALAPALVKQASAFRVEDSVIFSVAEEFGAIAEYSQAVAALENDDQAGFKKHITEAFWLSPRQATAFAPLIDQLRLDAAMAEFKFDFQQRVLQQGDAKAGTIAEFTENSAYVLLHFWSPWSTECEANLPDFLAMTAELQRNGIPVLSVLTDSSPEALADAQTFHRGLPDAATGIWIVDNSTAPLAHQLRVQALPTVALLSRNGAVLFNGHPSQDELWNELRKAVPAIKRPASPDAEPLPDEDDAR